MIIQRELLILPFVIERYSTIQKTAQNLILLKSKLILNTNSSVIKLCKMTVYYFEQNLPVIGSPDTREGTQYI